MIVANPILVQFDTTLNEFLAQQNLFVNLALASEVLLYKRDDSDSTNYERIRRKYTVEQQQVNDLLVSTGAILTVEIVQGTTIYLPNVIANREVLAGVVPDQFTVAEFKPFMANALSDLLRDNRYTNELLDVNGRQFGRVIANELTVLMWVRALSPLGDNSQSGRWINVSSFVESVTINSVGAGGSFTLSMQNVVCSPSKIDGWQFEANVRTSGSDSVVNETIVKQNLLGDYKRNDFLFHTVVQQNDLVLIKMEKLGIEKKRPFEIDDTSSPFVVGQDKCYDMIGLVDNTTINTSPGDLNISIVGRDLTKVLIEDSSIFFPEQFAQDIFSTDGVLAKRNRLELDLQSVVGTYQFKTIDTILKFIFNKYSNIGLIPDQVFTMWGSRSIVSKYPLSGNFTTTPTTQLSQVTTNQFGSSLSLINNVSSQTFLSQASERFLTEQRSGVWRIMELVIDPQIRQRVLVDNNINHDSGSIINTINKICQTPFVQFYTDTYGDKFYMIARKAPFDELGYKGMIYDSIETEVSVPYATPTEQAKRLLKVGRLPDVKKITKVVDNLQSLAVIEIDDSQVLSDNLSYHDEVYSWFRIVPRGLGLNDQTLFTLTPIITLDDYGEVFGSRPLSVEYNYCPVEFIGEDSKFKSNVNYVEAQVFKDLQFLVQSYQYLPFTRRGTITIDGDRRIKKGTFIRYTPTDEIFYVDGVSNTRSVVNGANQRQTVLSVTRGMREKYINGVEILFGVIPKKVSYFNIVNTALPSTANINNKDFLKTWIADKDIFNFFVQRRQWVN